MRWDLGRAGARCAAAYSEESRLSWSELYPIGPSTDGPAGLAEIFSPDPMALPHPTVAVLALLSAGLVVACSNAATPTSPTPSPLTTAQIQARYSAAAKQYNTSETHLSAAENASCDAGSPTAALTACQTALSQQRQATIAYDDALRADTFSGNGVVDASHLLGDDAAIEAKLEQAATAPSLAVIATLEDQIIPLLATAARDAAKLRTDIGLPAPA